MTFWDVQVNAIKCLQKLGIKKRLADRIAIFQMWLELNRLELKFEKNEEKISEIADARDALNGLLYFRNSGLEPKNLKGVYIR